MSYCELLGFTNDKQMVIIKQYKNARGWAAYIWGALFERYLKSPNVQYDTWLRRADELFALFNDERLSHPEKLTLWSTFDRSMLKIFEIPTLSAAYSTFLEKYPPGDSRVCHLPEMLKDLAAVHDKPGNIEALAWYGTSVSENPWLKYDVNTDKHRVYDIEKGTKHDFLSTALLRCDRLGTSELEKGLPMLDALLCGEPLWNIEDTLPQRKERMHELHAALKEEHDYLLDNEPPDEFHGCVVLGALNMIGGLLGIRDV